VVDATPDLVAGSRPGDLALESAASRLTSDIALFELNSRYSEVRRVSYPMDPMRRFQSDSPKPVSPQAHPQLLRLAALLEWSYGFRTPNRATNHRLTRRSPSAGALYPTECFVLSRAIGGWAVYYYDYGAHTYYRLARPHIEDLARWLKVEEEAPVVILGSVLWRSAQRYGTRCYLYCLLDAGNVAGNLAVAARCHGLDIEMTARSITPGHERQLGIRQGEGALLSMRICDNDSSSVEMPMLPRTLPAANGHGLHAPMLSPVFTRIKRFHQRTLSAHSFPLPLPLPEAMGERAFQMAAERRRSAAAFALEQLDGKVAEAMTTRCAEVLRRLDDGGGPRLSACVVSPRVSGWPTSSRSLEPTGEIGNTTRQFLHAREASERLADACQNQTIVRECAFALVLQIDLGELAEHGHEGFRAAAIAAGAVCADLYREASRAAIATTSVGGFSLERLQGVLGMVDSWPLVVQVFGVEHDAEVKADAAVMASATENRKAVSGR
jgi:SagB-type dehydrogenase family enzyme